MAIRTYNFTFDVKRSIMPEPVFIRQNDSTGATLINVHLVDNGVPVTINGDLEFRAMTADSQNVIADTTGFSNIDIDKGAFSYALPNQLSMTPGKIRIAYFMMVDASGNASTLSFVIFVKPSADLTPSGAKNYISIVDGLIKAFNEWNETAHSSWQDFVNGNKEIIESIDPGGKVISELIDFRHSDMLSKTFDTAKLRGDFFDNDLRDRSVNIKWFGAVGDGVTDDTKAIQTAIDSLGTTGGTIMIPNGVYMIKADAPEQQAVTYLRDAGGISVPSNTTINLAPGTELKAIPTDEGAYNILRLVNVHDVVITGGKITGERDLHTPKIGPSNTVGEWGYGIELQGSSNIVIRDISLTDFWGDGINIQVGKTICQNVTIDNVVCNNNRRQGMSIEALEHGLICNSIFENTIGTAPACGIDLEPWSDAIVNNDILIENNQFLNNDNCGLLVTGNNLNKQIKVKDNYFVGNSGKAQNGQLYAQHGNDILIENNDFLGNDSCFYGISVNHFNGVNVINNRLKDAGFISLSGLIDCVIDGNQFIMTKLTNSVTMKTNNIDQRIIVRNNLFNSLKVPLPTADITNHLTTDFGGESLEIVNNTLINEASGIFARCVNSRIDGNQIHAAHYGGISSNGASTDIVNNVITGAGSLNYGSEAVGASQAIVIGESAINNYVANNIIRKESADDYYPDYFKSASNPNGKVPAHINIAIVLDNMDHSKPLYTTLNSNHVYGDNITPYVLADINFRDGLFLLSQIVGSGGIKDRPSDAVIGSVFFDTSLGKPIFCKADLFSGAGMGQTWVTSDGTKV